MKYILIMWMTNFGGNAAAITTAEYSDKPACEVALHEFINTRGTTWYHSAICTPKSGG